MKHGERDLTGRTLDNWTLTRRLGSGGFGAVYKAKNRTIGRPAAVKVLHPDLAFQDDAKRRFLDEARVAGGADHDHIVQVFDGNVTQDGIWYLVMELLRGETLADRLAKRALSVPEAVVVGMQIASALEAAHAIHVVHRDVKPENVFLIRKGGRDDFVKLLDFGIQKLKSSTPSAGTEPGTQMGTPWYMSPEQWKCLRDLDGRSDIYSLGVLLFRALTGVLPYQGETHYDLLSGHLNTPVPDPAALVPLPPALAQLVQRMMAKQPADRPQTCREVIAALDAVAPGLCRVPDPPLPLAPEEDVTAEHEAALAPGPHRDREIAWSSTLRRSSGEIAPRRTAPRRRRMVVAGAIGVAGVAIATAFLGQPLPGRPKPPPPAPALAAIDAAVGDSIAPGLPPELAAFGPATFAIGWGDGASLDGPAHRVSIGRFALGRYEVTTEEFRRFAEATHLSGPKPWDGVDDFALIARLPVNLVTQREAAAYCAWRYANLGGRLPTEEEWEYAARDGDERVRTPEGRDGINVGPRAGAAPRLVPVDSPGASRSGLYQILGNVAEWTSSAAALFPGSLLEGSPAGAVVRGGSATSRPDLLRATDRVFAPPARRNPFIGFRCAATP